MAEFRRVSSSTARINFDQKSMNMKPFSKGDVRSNTADTEKTAIFADAMKKKAQGGSKEDIARYVRVKKEFDAAAEAEVASIVALSDELEKANKDMKKAQTALEKQSAIAAKRKALEKTINHFKENSAHLLELMAHGGADSQTWNEFEKIYEKIAVETGKNAKEAKAKLEEFKSVAKKIQEKGGSQTEIFIALKESLGEFASDLDGAMLAIEKIIPGLDEAGRAAAELEKHLLDQAKELKKAGKHLRAGILRFKATGRSGHLFKGAADSSVLDVLSGGKSKDLSKYAGKDGGLNNAEIYKTLLSGMGSAAKAGFEAYRNSRQYGTMGMGFGDVYGTYQAHKREVAKVALTTGVSEEQANAAYGGVAANLRVGTADPKARYQQMVDLTKQTIQLANATGLSEDRVTKLATAYRRNFSGGPMKAMKETTEGIAGALQNINSQVGDDFKLTSEDVADVWDRLAGDIENSGLDMKKLMSYSQGTAIAFGQMGVNTSKTLEMMKRVESFKTGKGGAAEGDTMAAAMVMMGGGPKLGANAGAAIGGSQKFAQANAGLGGEEFTNRLAAKAKGTSLQDFMAGFINLKATDARYADVLQALMGGADPIEIANELGGDRYIQMVRTLFNLPNSKQMFGTTMEAWDKEFMAKLDRMGAAGRPLKAAIMSGEGEATRRAAAKADAITAMGKAQGKSPEQIQKEVQVASGTNAKLAAAADPMAAFGKAVNIFSGSVNTFAALTAAKGLFDLFKMRGGGMPGGMPGGAPGSSIPGGPASGTGVSSAVSWLGSGGGALPGALGSWGASGGGLAITGAKGALLSGATSVPVLGALGYGIYQGFAGPKTAASEELLNTGISGTEYTANIDKNAEEWVDTFNASEKKRTEAWDKGNYGEYAGAALGTGLKYAGYIGSSIVAAGQDLGSTLKGWLGFGDDKPAQATGVQSQTTNVNVNAEGGTTYYDASRGGQVSTIGIFTPDAVAAQSVKKGLAAQN